MQAEYQRHFSNKNNPHKFEQSQEKRKTSESQYIAIEAIRHTARVHTQRRTDHAILMEHFVP